MSKPFKFSIMHVHSVYGLTIITGTQPINCKLTAYSANLFLSCKPIKNLP